MFSHDLRIAVRNLLKSRGFTLTAVLMLAFGVGATTAIFSVVECVVLRPLPFPDSDRLVRLNDVIQGADIGGNGEAGVTGPDIQNYMRDTHSFASLGGIKQTGFELAGIGDPAQINATRMSGGVFTALEVQPFMGRYYTQQEDDQKQQVAVIRYSMWRQRLHGDGKVLGTKILLDRKPYEIIGVMPRNFEFPLVPRHLNQSELWVPLTLTSEESGPNGAGNWNFDMIGRLKPGISSGQSQSDAERVAEVTERSLPSFISSLRFQTVVRSLREDTVVGSRPLVRSYFSRPLSFC
jgi:MacB-like periplasmic core domain